MSTRVDIALLLFTVFVTVGTLLVGRARGEFDVVDFAPTLVLVILMIMVWR